MNLKQQLAGVTIVIAVVFCLAWLAPSETTKNKEETKTTGLKAKSSLPVTSKGSTLYQLARDTIITPIKKQEVKIIVTDSEGKKQEYNSLKALPDSLKDRTNFQGNSFFFNVDSLIIKGKAISEQLNGVFNDTAFLKFQREIAEEFNSPEFKKKQEELMKNLNSADFKKQQSELMKNLKSEGFKKQQEELLKKWNSEDFKNQQAELMARLNSKVFKEGQREALHKLGQRMPTLKLDGPDFTISGVDSLFFSGENKGNYRIFMDSKEKSIQEKELENNKQYQKLKKKFEKDVEKLRKKQVEESKK